MKQKKVFQMFEQAPHPHRSGRFYEFENKWYFMAREYQDQGPFASKEDAIKGLEVFLEKIKEKENEVGTGKEQLN